MLDAVWNVTLALAPWLLLGMAIAGLLHVALPTSFVRRQLDGRWGVLKAVALGVPLPLCSCGVIPTGLGLKRDGASDGAAVGFLISTPQTGVDSILVSSSFLGWPFAVFKVVAAAITGIVGGLATDAVQPSRPAAGVTAAGERRARGVGELTSHSLEILRTIWHWVVFGIVVSAAIEVFVPEAFFTRLAQQGNVIPMLAVLLVSVPLYVCATASVPIAAALVAGGMPAGAALVFLMAGPATNVATMGAIHRALGRRALAVYLLTIVGGSFVAGLLFDSVLQVAPLTSTHIHGGAAWWAVASAILLLALMAWFALEDLRGLIARIGRGAHTADAGATIEIGVGGMSCGGCVSKLERALRDTDGVTTVVVTLDPARAVVGGTLDESGVRKIIEGVGFSVVETPG